MNLYLRYSNRLMRIIQLNRRSDIRQDLIPDMRTSVKDFFKVFIF